MDGGLTNARTNTAVTAHSQSEPPVVRCCCPEGGLIPRVGLLLASRYILKWSEDALGMLVE